MQWRIVLGAVVLVLAAVRLALVLLHFEASSYGMGQLTAGILFCLVGVWLIHSGRQQVKR
jgi:hypothetical protein